MTATTTLSNYINKGLPAGRDNRAAGIFYEKYATR